MNGELRTYPDLAALSRAAAMHFVEVAQAAVALNRRFSVALAGGATPELLYRLLATPEYSGQIDWKHTHLFWTDERCVPPDHPDSNYGMAWKSFIDAVPISMDNLHRIFGEIDPVIAAETYEQELKDHFKMAVPRFDLILLGLGEDGHTASIFPGTTAATESTRLAVAVQHPQSNRWRVTLTLPSINHAANVTVLVAGAQKAPTLAKVTSGRAPLLPAANIQPVDGRLIWMADSAAAGVIA